MFLGRTPPYSTSTKNPRPTPISEAELIKKRDILDPLEDDDDIDWKHNPFDADFIDDESQSPEQLMSKITFKGSPQLWFKNLSMFSLPRFVESQQQSSQ